MGKNTSSGVPQFSTAEYGGKAGETLCKACAQRISGSYYLLNGAPVCASCAQRIRDEMPQDTHTSFVRGVLFGVGGALLGLGIYVAFALATGWMIGYISLAVGYLVGRAIALGSGGVGGRRYQVAAVLLTYSAVSLAAVPIALSQHMKHSSPQQHAQASEPAAVHAPKMSLARAAGVLTLLGLVSPFLELADPAHGIIGLIILFVGIRIAWKITAARQVNLSGPISEQPVPATPG
jgi:NAD/NADP transhydrogenase beta subunit